MFLVYINCLLSWLLSWRSSREHL